MGINYPAAGEIVTCPNDYVVDPHGDAALFQRLGNRRFCFKSDGDTTLYGYWFSDEVKVLNRGFEKQPMTISTAAGQRIYNPFVQRKREVIHLTAVSVGADFKLKTRPDVVKTINNAISNDDIAAAPDVVAVSDIQLHA